MKNVKHSDKNGYTLLLVMVAALTLSVAVTALFKFGELARMNYSRNVSDKQAFWLAQAGISEVKAMALKVPRNFGEFGLPEPDEPFTRNMAGGSYTVEITEKTGNEYLITSTATYGNSTKTITLIAVLEPFSFSVLTTKQPKRWKIRFTKNDHIDGPIYMDGEFWVENKNNPPLFDGAVKTTSDQVYYGLGDDPVVYPDGYTDSSFLQGLYLNQASVDFEGKNSMDYIKHVKDNADVILNGKHTIKFTSDGKAVYSGANGVPSTNSINETTIYVNGQLTVSGTLNGEVTIGCNERVTILDEGIQYESAPSETHDTWSDDDIDNIDDYLGIISKHDIVCEGSDPINLHGSFMVTDGGIYPEERRTTFGSDKPNMYVFGSITESVFEWTEASSTKGFGTYWSYDPRLATKILKNFPARGYSFKRWTFVDHPKNNGKNGKNG